MTSLLLDTDVGTDVDDAYALILAARLPDADLLSVTTVSGSTELRARLAHRLLSLAGFPSIRVAPGYSSPLTSDRFSLWLPDGGLWMGHEGQGVLLEDEIRDAQASDADPRAATDLIAATLVRSADPAVVVTIGPWTNLARVLAGQPGLAAHVTRHVAMGGAVLGEIQIGGHPVSPLAEFNLNADREAAVRVLEAQLSSTLVPAEFTYRSIMSVDELNDLRCVSDPAMASLVALTDVWVPVYQGIRSTLGVPHTASPQIASHLHDSLTVLLAARPELFDLLDVRIDVIEQDGVLRTIASPGGAFPVTVVRGGDQPKLKKEIFDLLTSGVKR